MNELPSMEIAACLGCGIMLYQVGLAYVAMDVRCPTHGDEHFVQVYLTCTHCGRRSRANLFAQWLYTIGVARMN